MRFVEHSACRPATLRVAAPVNRLFFCCSRRCAVNGYGLAELGQARFVAGLRQRISAGRRFAGAIY
jgi:hypothetical protein